MKILTMLLNSNSIHPLTTKILFWYSINKRDLPWRKNPKPYNVWLSEIVFQQTRIEQGLAYYERLLEKFPTVYELAASEEREVLIAWEGLGYYSRARNLHHAAKTIVKKFDGKFPGDYKDILSLKGIGPYTAAAISSIAFANARPAIDGNVLRVSSRLFLIEEPIDKESTKKNIEKALTEIIDIKHPGDFNQAMMELGALVCKPKNPHCKICPISEHCLAFHSGKQDQLPIRSKKVLVKKVYYSFLVISDLNNLLITKRKEGIWKKMYQFPLIESDELLTIEGIRSVLERSSISPVNTIYESKEYKHILSHRTIYAKFWMIKVEGSLNYKNAISIHKDDLGKYPFPRLIHRFLESEEAIQYLLM